MQTQNTRTAAAAIEYRANIGHDTTMLDALDPEYLDDAPAPAAPAHPLATIKETVKVVRGRKVITTTCGPYRI